MLQFWRPRYQGAYQEDKDFRRVRFRQTGADIFEGRGGEGDTSVIRRCPSTRKGKYQSIESSPPSAGAQGRIAANL